MKLQVWSAWSLFSDYIQNTFLSSLKKTNKTQLIICPEMGKNNAFPNNKVFVLRSGFIGMINLAFTICSPVCPQGNYHSLLILLHWKGWKDRHFQKSYQKELISIEKNDSSILNACGISVQEHFLWDSGSQTRAVAFCHWVLPFIWEALSCRHLGWRSYFLTLGLNISFLYIFVSKK